MTAIANDARFWDRIARKYAASPIADVAGYERTLEHTRRLLKPSDTALEVGCGTGTTALHLAPSVQRYVATDVSGEMVTIGREKAEAAGCANLAFEVARPDAAAWAPASFDVVLAFNLLHLVAARTEALKALHDALKPGGLFISKTPCLKEMNPLIRIAAPVMQLFGKAPYVGFFSAQEFEREIEAAGFEIVERARHGSEKRDARLFLVARRT